MENQKRPVGMMEKTKEFAVLYLVGAAVYSLIEILWRGTTHWTMALTGGVCFLLLHLINTTFRQKPLFFKCFLGAVAITEVEFVVGCVLNRTLRLNVWDYSGNAYNLLGQTCLLYSVLWFFLSILGFFLSSFLEKRVLPKLKTKKRA